MKAVTPVIATMLLIVVTISMVGTALIIFSRTSETSAETASNITEQKFKQFGTEIRIDSAVGSRVYVRNTGSVAIPASALSFYVNDEYVAVTSAAQTINPGEIGEFNLTTTLTTYQLTITGGKKPVSTTVTPIATTIVTTTTVATTTTTSATTTTLGCTGNILLLLNPIIAAPSASVTPSASGLSNCNGKTIEFRQDSCTGTQVGSCVSASTGCTATLPFTAPGISGDYNYMACVDKNGVNGFNDAGETDSERLIVTQNVINLIDGSTGGTFPGRTSIYCPAATDCKVAYYDGTDQDITFADCNDGSCSAPPAPVDVELNAGLYGISHKSIFCPAATDCKIVYSAGGLNFADCNDASCSTKTVTNIAGSNVLTGSVYCISSTDCKVVYWDNTVNSIVFVDCNDSSCSARTASTIDSDVGDASAVSLYCPTTDDCKIVYHDDTDGDETFVDCNDTSCSAPVVTDIDIDSGINGVGTNTNLDGKVSIYCPTATDCKIAYVDWTPGGVVKFADCNDAACSVPVVNTIGGGSNGARIALYCPAATDCKIAYYDDSQQDITFADCNDASCSTMSYSDSDIDVSVGTNGHVSLHCPAADDCKISYYDGNDGSGAIKFVDCGNAACK